MVPPQSVCLVLTIEVYGKSSVTRWTDEEKECVYFEFRFSLENDKVRRAKVIQFPSIYYEWQKIISNFFLGHLSFNFSIIFFLAEIKISFSAKFLMKKIPKNIGRFISSAISSTAFQSVDT